MRQGTAFGVWIGGVVFAGMAMGQSAPCGAYPAGASEYACTCTGTETGSVWGDGPYTSDSNICVAARHAGLLKGGMIEVRAYAAPGQASYPAGAANGVQTSSWGSYGSSFTFASGGIAACGSYPGGAGPVICSCDGSESGPVWGSGPYTSDSNLCVAARHAGAITHEGGVVTVLGLGGLNGYAGSVRNGVTTSGWGSYGESITFDWN
jgi:hypothetical protein